MAVSPTQLVSMVRREQGKINSVEAEHIKRLSSTINELEKNIRSYMGQLQTTAGGRLTGVKVNLKQAQAIHKKMLVEFQTTYGVAVRDMVDDYDELSDFIEGSFKSLDKSISFSGYDQTMMDLLKQQSYDDYMQYGTAAQNRIATGMYNAVIAGHSRAQLEQLIRGVLTGHKDVRGRPMETYAKQHTKDAVMNFYNEVHQKKAEDVGLKHFMYFGDIINTSRDFCRIRVGKYYTKKTINSWKHAWTGKRGNAWDYRGGWNCRHHWRGIDPDWLEEDEFGPIEEDEMAAYMEEDNFSEIKATISEKEGLKRQHAASLAKSKTLRAQREKLKGLQVTPARTQKIKDLRQELIAEKGIRDNIKGGVVKAKTDLAKQGRKIKRDVAEGVTPKALTKAELEPVTVKASASAKDLGISSIQDRSMSRKKFKDFDKQVVTPFKEQMSHIANMGDGSIGKQLKDMPFNVEVFNESEIPRALAKKTMEASYNSGKKRIRYAIKGDSLLWKKGAPRSGYWRVSEHGISTYSHEVGHHVQDVVMDKRLVSRWNQTFHSQPESWWKTNLSQYGSLNAEEAFAESFAAFTNTKYKRGMLPKDVEGFFDDLFGVKQAKKLAKTVVKEAVEATAEVKKAWSQTLYHGANEAGYANIPKEGFKFSSQSIFGKGVYFTDKKTDAAQWAFSDKAIFKVKANVKNVMTVDFTDLSPSGLETIKEWSDIQALGGEKARQAFLKAGYDGYSIKLASGETHFIVLDPKLIELKKV